MLQGRVALMSYHTQWSCGHEWEGKRGQFPVPAALCIVPPLGVYKSRSWEGYLYFIAIGLYAIFAVVIRLYIYIVELRTPAMPVGIGGGKERGGCHLNLRTWHAEGRWPILGLCWPTPMRTKCCKLQHFALWDGKNPCKYHSLSPRKWLKHSYWQSLVHITIVDFLKNA